jgi:hypothetical protein
VRAERVAVGDLTVRMFDHGPEPAWHEDRSLYGPWQRYEAELAEDATVRERGGSPWEALHRLVSNRRAELERRWAETEQWVRARGVIS